MKYLVDTGKSGRQQVLSDEKYGRRKKESGKHLRPRKDAYWNKRKRKITA